MPVQEQAHSTPSVAGYARGMYAAAAQNADAAWGRAGDARLDAVAAGWTEEATAVFEQAWSDAELATEQAQAAGYYAATGARLDAEPEPEPEAGW